MPQHPYNKVQAIGDLEIIVSSPIIRAILQEHKIHLQKQVNRYVRENDGFKAYGELCKMDDIGRCMAIFENKLKELRKEKADG